MFEQARVLAIVGNTSGRWHEVAGLLEAVGSARDVLAGKLPDELDARERAIEHEVRTSVSEEEIKRYRALIDELLKEDVQLLTVLDPEYPPVLREIYNRPPFLFLRGELTPDDSFAVSVVGTRRASRRGLATARDLAAGLVGHGVTVLSGLAAGIDTAVHEAALDAGGRTVAVLGTGIRRVYPAENAALAKRIIERGGAVISQFWPDAPPTRFSFPMRNVVTSGMGIGTVVVEASGHSGARNQATHCLDHGKRLFLIRDLVMQEEWAQRYARRPGATVVDSVHDVVAVLTAVVDAPRQLMLC